MIVDEMHEEHPELLKDQYWEEVVPKDLPYTVASEHYRRHEPKGSAEHYKVKESDAMYANILPGKRSLNDDVYADYESVDTPMVERRKNWFSRQMHRMGSMRSSSTAYSSGGLFNRNRLNSGNENLMRKLTSLPKSLSLDVFFSVYSSPEAGLNSSHLGSHLGSHQQSVSVMNKFANRKSGRSRQFIKQSMTKNFYFLTSTLRELLLLFSCVN